MRALPVRGRRRRSRSAQLLFRTRALLVRLRHRAAAGLLVVVSGPFTLVAARTIVVATPRPRVYAAGDSTGRTR